MQRLSIGRLIRVWRFLRRPDVGLAPKLVALVTLLYIISPVDLLPGLPLLGWFDDALAAALGWALLNLLMEAAEPGGEGRG